ncbi:MAG: DMT family transporter [Marinicaulis sp.]|nr:DMT family transporter [Marinicaulis sp.]
MSPREFAVLITMCLLWGFHFVVIKIAVGEIPPIFYAAIRMTLVAFIMARFLRWRPGEMAPVMGAAVCLGALNYSFMFTGVKFATASTAAIALELFVPFATILSVIFLGERIGLPRILGMAFAFAGVAIIALGKDDHISPETRIGLGVGLVACGAFVEGVGAVLIKKATSFKPHELLAWFSLIGAICLWLITIVFESGQQEALAAADKNLIIGAILYSAIGGSIIGHSAYYWLLKRLPMSVVAPSVLLTTLIAVFFSVILLDEPFGPRFIIGGAMVLAGVGVVILRNTANSGIKAPSSEVTPTP